MVLRGLIREAEFKAQLSTERVNYLAALVACNCVADSQPHFNFRDIKAPLE
jgi:hypothetical protein